MTSRNRLSMQPPRRRGVPALMLLPAVFLLAAPAAQAQSPAPPPPTIEEIDAWVGDAMARWEVPGLGLAIVYSLVQGWDGKISVYSSPGNGAAFEILIPRLETEA